MQTNIREITKSEFNYKRDDKKISISLMAYYVILTVQYFILMYFNLIGTSVGSSIQLLSKALVGVAFVYALPSVLKRSKIKFIAIYFVAIFIFISNFTIFPENKIYIKEILFPFFFISLPGLVYSLSIYDLLIFKETMKKASAIVFAFGGLISIFVFLGKAYVGDYSMSLSYYMLLPTIMILDGLWDKFSLKMLSLFIFALIAILGLGSRGAVLCLLVFIFLKLYKTNKRKSYKSLLAYSSLIFFSLFGIVFFKHIINYIYKVFLQFGIRSRTLSTFLMDKVHLSGRDVLYKQLIEELVKKPLLGMGILGDRQINGGYIHNFFLEIMAHFGIIFGVIISVTLLVIIFRVLSDKDPNKYNMIIIWISLGFVPLMVSGSYLKDIQFWILIGLLINITSKKKRLNMNIKQSEI